MSSLVRTRSVSQVLMLDSILHFTVHDLNKVPLLTSYFDGPPPPLRLMSCNLWTLRVNATLK